MGNGNGSDSQVGLLLQVAGKVDGLEKRCDHFFGHFSEQMHNFSEQMREVTKTLGVIATTLARSVEVNNARLGDHEHRITKLEKSR